MLSRRVACKNLALLAGLIGNPFQGLPLGSGKNTTILLVSGWQYYNIGDIAHTPGLLHLLNTYLPEAKVVLWPNHEVRAIDEMLHRNFPDLEIVEGSINEDHTVNRQLQESLSKADFLLHGSGPSLVGAAKIQWWKDRVKKPYGIYGVTLQRINSLYQELLKDATFVFTRETYSLKNLKEENLEGSIMGFGPDATFAMHLRDDSKALHFLNLHHLEHKKFLCVIPRLRKTPYYKIYPDRGWTDDQIRGIDDLNSAHMEADFEKARTAMITWVRQTGYPVLVCPEMTYQLEIMDALINPLPEDVRARVIQRKTYWLCDEAASVYAHAFAIISFECHSPIMAAYNGTPAFYLRQPEDTIKGQMWYDIGLDKWVFEIEDVSGTDISTRLMDVYDNYQQALRYLEIAMDRVRALQLKSMRAVRNALLD